MKRSASPLPTGRSQRRRSNRIAPKRVRLEDVSIEEPCPRNDLGLWRVEEVLETHNIYREFARRNPQINDSNLPLLGTEIEETVREIRKIAEQAHKKLDKHYGRLQKSLFAFQTTNMRLPEVYEAGDLFCKCKISTNVT